MSFNARDTTEMENYHYWRRAISSLLQSLNDSADRMTVQPCSCFSIPRAFTIMLPSTYHLTAHPCSHPLCPPWFRRSIFRPLPQTSSPLTLTLPWQLASVVHINWHSVWNWKFKYCECLPNAPRIFIGEHYTLDSSVLWSSHVTIRVLF
jgi:hypothetical protein